MLRTATTPFEAIAHPVRRDLLDALRESPEPLSVTDLGARCEVSRSTASRHLDILRGAGLVVARNAAPAIHHELDRSAFDAIDDWLWRFLDAPHLS
jgi:DNA-binding transcriptional ArsR family regulator